MSYRMLEELQNRRKEKVAVFLTFENIVGLILVFFPVFLGSSALLLLVRGPLCVGAALLGVVLTLETHGLPIYARALWHVRGVIRLRLRGAIITPNDLAGAIPPSAPERPLPLDGPVQAIGHGPQVHRGQSRSVPRPHSIGDRQFVQNGHAPQGGVHADPAAE